MSTQSRYHVPADPFLVIELKNLYRYGSPKVPAIGDGNLLRCQVYRRGLFDVSSDPGAAS
jgi:hypothetical protein